MRLELGALVLGALPVDERRSVDAHLATCATCRAELAELAPLAALLNRVPAADVLDSDVPVDDPDAPVPDLLAAVLARAARANRRARLRQLGARTLVGAAATGIIVLGAVLATGGLGHRTPSTEVVKSAAVVLAARDTTTGVSGGVTLQQAAAGTDVALRLRGVPAGEECRLVAHAGPDQDVTASWDATYSGEATFTGSTRFTVDQIDALTVETPLGRTLLTLPVG